MESMQNSVYFVLKLTMGWLHSIPNEFLNSDVPFYKLLFNVKIWNRDTHGLFDFDNKELMEKKVEINGNSFVFGEQEFLYSRIPNNDIVSNTVKINLK